MKKFQFLAPIVALIIGIGSSAFSFKKSATPDHVYWQFESDDVSDARVASEYTMIDIEELPNCDDGEVLPCVLEVDASIDSEPALDSYLSNQTQFPDDEAVVDQAFQTKSN